MIYYWPSDPAPVSAADPAFAFLSYRAAMQRATSTLQFLSDLMRWCALEAHATMLATCGGMLPSSCAMPWLGDREQAVGEFVRFGLIRLDWRAP
jgi:hypothetical protein